MNNKIESYWSTKPGDFSSDLIEWMNWFDKCESIQEFQKTGTIDFMHKIFSNGYLYNSLGDPGKKTALEIGVGAGRLTNVSCKIFRHVHGIDIHDYLTKTEELLKNLGNDNFTLHQYKDEKRSSLVDNLKNKIDFVYSFIVFQHFQSWSTAENYINLVDEVMTPNGCGKIFFGLNNVNDRDILERDMYEDQAMTLCVSPNFVKDVFQKKFDIIEMGITTKRMWNDSPSGQFYISFKRKNT